MSASVDLEKDWKWSPNRYGVFGWFETVIKAIASGVGIGSLAAFSSVAPTLYAYRIVQAVCVGILLLLHAVTVAQRFFYKEVFAFFFSIFVVIGNIIILIVIFQNSGQPGTFIFTFSFCFFLGEGCRYFQYLMKPPRMDWDAHVLLEEEWKRYLVTTIIVVAALIAWIFQVVIWTTTYIET